MATWRILFSLGLFAVSFVHGQNGPHFVAGEDPRPTGTQWERVENMSDEFEGDAIDLQKWQIEPVQNSFTWIGRPPGLFQAESVSVKDGDLRVQVGVLDEPYEGEEGTYLYSGGIVRSIHPGEPGWYFECRMKANATEMSSTFWLLTEGGPDEALETDIQECVGRITPLTKRWARNWNRIFHSNTIHWRYFTEPRETKSQGWADLEETNSSRYFVYGAWWKSDSELRFLFGWQVHVLNSSKVQMGYPRVFAHGDRNLQLEPGSRGRRHGCLGHAGRAYNQVRLDPHMETGQGIR